MQRFAKNRFRTEKSNHSKISILLLLLTVAAFTANCLLATGASAVESMVMVEWEKQFKKKLENIQDTTEKVQTNNSTLREERAKIFREFTQTTNADDRVYLEKKMLAVRAREALNTTEALLTVQQTIEELMGDLQHYKRLKKNTGVNGASSGSAEHKKMARNLIVGLDGLSRTVNALAPTSEEAMGIREKLAMTDATFKSYFTNNESVSISKQIEYLENHHSTMAAALNLLEREKANLRNYSNMIREQDIRAGIDTIKLTGLESVYKSIMNGDDRLGEMIRTNNQTKSLGTNKNAFFDTNRKLGDW